MLRTKLFVFIALLALLGIGMLILRTPAPVTDPETRTSEKLRVVTALYPIQFFVQRIGGEYVEVINLTPPGAEPHDYETTAQDLIAIEQSDLLVLNGVLEHWAENLQTTTPIVTVGKEFLSLELEKGKEVMSDPHVWLDPVLAQRQSSIIATKLGELDPENVLFYQGNAGALVLELGQLDAMFREGLKTCERKDFITSHAAFGYLASRYSLRQVPIAGLSPEEEPSAKQLAEITNFAHENNATHIFFETLVSPELSETIAQEIGAKTLVLNPLEGLTQEEKLNGKSYFTIMQENLTNLRIALQCT